MPDPTVTILPETLSSIPEPPPMPNLWIVRWWEWQKSQFIKEGWNLRTSMFPCDSVSRANTEAATLLAKGCRRVQVIKISGDTNAPA